MASRNATIGEAVKAALNAAAADPAAFGQSFTAKRVYVPAADLEAMAALTVTVYAGGDEPTPVTRARFHHDVSVEVGIQQRLPDGVDPSAEAANATIDPLMELVERVADFFRPGAFVAAGVPLLKVALTPPDPQHLLQLGVFTAVVTFTFKADA